MFISTAVIMFVSTAVMRIQCSFYSGYVYSMFVSTAVIFNVRFKSGFR